MESQKLRLKVLCNKANNQLHVTIPRKKLDIDTLKMPRYINIDKIDLEW